MAFSWKTNRRRAILKLKMRIRIMEKIGADTKLHKIKLERMLKKQDG